MVVNSQGIHVNPQKKMISGHLMSLLVQFLFQCMVTKAIYQKVGPELRYVFVYSFVPDFFSLSFSVDHEYPLRI